MSSLCNFTISTSNTSLLHRHEFFPGLAAIASIIILSVMIYVFRLILRLKLTPWRQKMLVFVFSMSSFNYNWTLMGVLSSDLYVVIISKILNVVFFSLLILSTYVFIANAFNFFHRIPKKEKTSYTASIFFLWILIAHNILIYRFYNGKMAECDKNFLGFYFATALYFNVFGVGSFYYFWKLSMARNLIAVDVKGRSRMVVANTGLWSSDVHPKVKIDRFSYAETYHPSPPVSVA